MTIRFRCNTCHRRLTVGDRQAGSAVRCPNCKARTTVPSADSEPAAAPEGQAGETVVISRRVIYAQGALIATVALVAFLLGYFLGGAGRDSAQRAAVPSGPVQITGKLTYGSGAADAGAVVIVLPEESVPDEKIAVEGLAPHAPAPDGDAVPLRALRSLGGEYRRSDGQGEFVLQVPRAGKYHVLLLSKAARRPPDMPPKAKELAVLGRYFEFAPDLLADRQYLWQTLDITADRALEHHF